MTTLADRITRLVGRTIELASLEEELRRASQGEFRCVLLSADPGIGKTRLAAEFLNRNRRRVIGLSARAYPLGRTASFGLWAEALDRRLRDLPAEKITSLCGGFLDDLTGLLHNVAAAHGSSLDHQTPRFRVFEGLAVLIRNLAASRPVVVVLDDVHDADGSSWETLNYLAHNLREAKVLVIAAARPAELFEETVATRVVLSLEQEGILRRVALDPLGFESVVELTEGVLDRQPPRALVDWLVERSQGNPLFALSLLAALLDEDADLTAPALRRLPEDLADRVTSRLKLLDESAIATLEMLAVVGHPVELVALARLSNRPLEALGEVLEDLERTRLVVEVEQGRQLTYEIVHPLVLDAVYQGIGGARRRALHRLAARALIDTGRLGEGAEHFARSADVGDNEAIEVLQEAIRQAEAKEAYEEALTMLGTLLDLLPAGDPRWTPVLEATSERDWALGLSAQSYAPLGTKVMRVLDRLLETSPNPTLRATVKLRLAIFLAWGRGAVATAEADDLLEQAVTLFEHAGDRRRVLLATYQLVWSRGIRGDFAGMAGQAKVLAANVEAAGERLLAMWTTFALGVACGATGEFGEAEAALRRAIAIAREEDKAAARSLFLGTLAMTLGAEGRVGECPPLLEEAKAIDPAWRERVVVPVGDSMLSWMRGDFRSTLAIADEMLSTNAASLGKGLALGLSYAALAATECDQLPRARRHAALVRCAYRDGDFLGLAQTSLQADAILAWRQGRRSEVLAGLRERLPVMLCDARSQPGLAFSLIDMVEMAAEAGHAHVAGDLRRALGEIAQRVGRDLHRSLADLGSAWAELVFGSEAEAAERARRASISFSRLGYRAFEGRALDVLGRSLTATNRDGALDAFERAVETLEACGAVWRAQRSLEGMRRLGSAGRRSAAASLGPKSLSNREREVARLASQGLTARQIAERLFIGQRTVETHLTSVYAKLGIESKLELVHRAAELVFRR